MFRYHHALLRIRFPSIHRCNVLQEPVLHVTDGVRSQGFLPIVPDHVRYHHRFRRGYMPDEEQQDIRSYLQTRHHLLYFQRPVKLQPAHRSFPWYL